MAEPPPPPPPPPFQPPPLAERGRSGRAQIQRSRPPMGFVQVNGYGGLYMSGYFYSQGYPFVRPGLPRPRPQMCGHRFIETTTCGNRFMETTTCGRRFMETTTEVVVPSGLVNNGTGVFHPRFPIIYNRRTTYTMYHPRVPFVYTNGANNNKDNKGKKKKQRAETADQTPITRNASNGNNAVGGSVESHEDEPSSEVDFLPDEWTY